MTVEPRGPLDWARFINLVLDEAYGPERYPISVVETAKMFTASKYPDDPIQKIEGGNFPGLEGMLIPAPGGQKGWGIFFNHHVPSRRRIRFTMAHEFGHYLLHRKRFPKGLQCSNSELPNRNRALATIEEEADIFASNLLMPIEDFKKQIGSDEIYRSEYVRLCCRTLWRLHAGSYSAMASLYQLRAVLVVSEEGYFDWSESSKAARRTGHKFSSFVSPPLEIPVNSLAAKRDITNYPKMGSLWRLESGLKKIRFWRWPYLLIVMILLLRF